MKANQNDPVIDEIREARRRISRRFGNDPARLVAYYVELQQQKYSDRLLAADKAPKPSEQPAA